MPMPKVFLMCKFFVKCIEYNNVTPEKNLKMQYCVSKLYGPNRVEVFRELLNIESEIDMEIYSQDPIKFAVNYNIYYGNQETKELAVQLASKLNMFSDDELNKLKISKSR